MNSKFNMKSVMMTIFLVPILTSGIDGLILQKEFELMLNHIDVIFSTENLEQAMKVLVKQADTLVQPNTTNSTDMVFNGFLVEVHYINTQIDNEFPVNTSVGEMVFKRSEVINCSLALCTSFQFLKPAILINEQLIVGDGANEMFKHLNEIQPCSKRTSIAGMDYYSVITFYKCQLNHDKLPILTRKLRKSKYYGETFIQHLKLERIDNSTEAIGGAVILICYISFGIFCMCYKDDAGYSTVDINNNYV